MHLIPLSDSAAHRLQTHIEKLNRIPAAHGSSTPAYGKTWAYAWWSGKVRSRPGPALQALDRARLLGDGQPALIVSSNSGFVNWEASFFNAVLNRDLGIIKTTFGPLLTAGTVMATGTSRKDRAALAHGVGIVDKLIFTGPRHLLVIVSDRGLDTRLRSFARAHPDLGLMIKYLPQMR